MWVTWVKKIQTNYLKVFFPNLLVFCLNHSCEERDLCFHSVLLILPFWIICVYTQCGTAQGGLDSLDLSSTLRATAACPVELCAVKGSVMDWTGNEAETHYGSSWWLCIQRTCISLSFDKGFMESSDSVTLVKIHPRKQHRKTLLEGAEVSLLLYIVPSDVCLVFKLAILKDSWVLVIFVEICGTSPKDNDKCVKIILVFLVYSMCVPVGFESGRMWQSTPFHESKTWRHTFLGGYIGIVGERPTSLQDLHSNSSCDWQSCLNHKTSSKVCLFIKYSANTCMDTYLVIQ